MNHVQSRYALIVCVLLSALIVVGCSESTQDKYNDATSHLADTKKARDKAKDAVKKAQKKLDEAQQKLQKARQKVIAARQSVNKVVNDEVLFRTLQRNLLNKDKFSNSAISVGVNNRVVTLTGSVPDEQTRKQALKTVRNQPGVKSINDQLTVSSSQNNAPTTGDGSDSGSNHGQTHKDKPQQHQQS